MPTFQLTPQQINFLIVGIGTAIVLYLMVKGAQWLFRSRSVNRVGQRRARQPDTARSAVKPTAAPAVKPAGTAVGVAAVSQDSATISESKLEANVSGPVAAHHSGSRENRTNQAAVFWPTEPQATQKRNLFEDVGIEYPYATNDDYRFGNITPALAELLPTSDVGRRDGRRLLRNAGYFEPHAWENFAATRYLWIMLPLILIGALLVIAPERFEPYLIGALVIGPALGWALPALRLRSRATERLRQIEIAMPDMLDLLNMCVSQGMTVINSLGRISSEFALVYPALSKELRIVTDQARVGSLVQALNNLSDRVDVPEVHSFTSLLIQTEQMGTSVSEALAEYSDGMRESQRQRADEKANSATFKLLFPTVLCLMPAVFLLLMGPALIELNQFFSRGGIQGLNAQSNQLIERQQEQSGQAIP